MNMSFRDKIEGNELDLSLNQLTEVPVKELAAATKATCLDLSCNRIETLPNDFATLTHLVKIDLSKNSLTELPAKFGNLLNLQHLDLYGNNIVSLPVSFCKLKNLRWLDLKNNPLEPKLKKVAGDCLDEKECQACARKVVAYMQSIESDQEREKQKRLKVAREKEAIERAKAERELEEQRRQKKIEKEKRKAESKAKREAQLQEDDSQNKKMDYKNEKDLIDGKQSKTFGAKGSGCLKVFFYSVVVASVAVLVGLLYGIHTENIPMDGVKLVASNVFVNLKSSLIEISRIIIYYIPKIKEMSLRFLYHYMGVLTNFSSNIEEFVALYA